MTQYVECMPCKSNHFSLDSLSPPHTVAQATLIFPHTYWGIGVRGRRVAGSLQSGQPGAALHKRDCLKQAQRWGPTLKTVLSTTQARHDACPHSHTDIYIYTHRGQKELKPVYGRLGGDSLVGEETLESELIKQVSRKVRWLSSIMARQKPRHFSF